MRFVTIMFFAIFIFCGCAGRVDSLNYKANLPQNSTFYLIDSSDEIDLGANVAKSNLDLSDLNTKRAESYRIKRAKKAIFKTTF